MSQRPETVDIFLHVYPDSTEHGHRSETTKYTGEDCYR